MWSVTDGGSAHRRSLQSHRFFGPPLINKHALAIERIAGNRVYSGLLHEALDPARGPDMKEAFIGLDLAPDDPELMAGKPFRARSTPGRSCRGFAKRRRGPPSRLAR
jgi:hypothetical protein